MEPLAKTVIIPARQNQFIQENIFNNAPDRRIANAMNSISASTGLYIENPVWYKQFYRRQAIILTEGRAVVNFDAADNCFLYVTATKAMNTQDDIPSIVIRGTMY